MHTFTTTGHIITCPLCDGKGRIFATMTNGSIEHRQCHVCSGLTQIVQVDTPKHLHESLTFMTQDEVSIWSNNTFWVTVGPNRVYDVLKKLQSPPDQEPTEYDLNPWNPSHEYS